MPIGTIFGSGAASVSSATHGIIDYNHAGANLPLVADTWTDIPNDKAGPFTNLTYAPSGIDNLMDGSTGYFDFSQLVLGDVIQVRIDFTVSPNINNALLKCRVVLGGGVNEYALTVFEKRLDYGSGVAYPSEKGSFLIYMGDLNTLNNPGKLQGLPAFNPLPNRQFNQIYV